MAGNAQKKISQHRMPEGDPPPKKSVSKAAKNPKTSLKKEFNKKADKPLFAGKVAPAEKQRLKLPGKTRFIITGAQNNTKVHEGFMNALETYAQENKAELIISKFTYNKNGFQNSTKDDVEELWYDQRIKPYLLSELTNPQTGNTGSNQSIQLAKNLIFGGEIDILPTAARPISGFESYFRGESGIIPHAKHEMVSLPGMKEDGAHFVYTTGACTKRNYIQRKAGQKADSHHTYGALVVEVDEQGDWFVRQIVADDTGAFYDLTDKYLPNGKVLHDQRVEAITWGDIHVEKMDPVVEKAGWAAGGMLDQLKPRYQFIHDIIDFTSRNHHNIDDPFFRHEQHFHGRHSVEGEIGLGAKFLKAAERKDTQTVVIESNHDLAFKKWLTKVENIKNDPQNAAYFHECLAKIYREMEKGNVGFKNKVLEWAMREKEKLDKTYFNPHNTSFKICPNAGGIECGLHGDKGPNGTKGSANGFRKLGDKSNVAHTHTAAIIDGVYYAGVSGKLDMGYNDGPGSWSHSHIVTYPNGKRAIVTMKNGKFRADFNKAAKKDNVVPLKPKNTKKTSGPGRKAA